MSRTIGAIDVGVVIGRVRVRVKPDAAPGLAVELPPPARGRAGDHRIVVGELCLDVGAGLSGDEARGLGGRVVRALGDCLAALQARRLDAIVAGRSRGGAVRVGRLRVSVRGGAAAGPDVRTIALAIAGAIERRVTP